MLLAYTQLALTAPSWSNTTSWVVAMISWPHKSPPVGCKAPRSTSDMPRNSTETSVKQLIADRALTLMAFWRSGATYLYAAQER